MFEFKRLEQKYNSDAPFNKIVNVHLQLLRNFGFVPSEIREAAFLAQYMYEMDRAEEIFRTKAEWEQLQDARNILQQAVLDVKSLAGAEPKSLEK